MNRALLCEGCGYEIGGLPTGGACPECGRAVAKSLPSARRGSPWQQRMSLFYLAETNWAALRRPHELFASVRPRWRTGAALLAVNCVMAAMMLVAPWSGVFIGDPLRGAAARGDASAALWVVPLQVLGVSALLAGLTALEWAGIQLVAKHRGWRLLPAAAWEVCAHASVGWVLMGGLMWLSLAVWLNVSLFVPGIRMGRDGVLMFGVPAFGLAAGLLVFEWLVWVGARACRFANAAEAAPAAPTAATAA